MNQKFVLDANTLITAWNVSYIPSIFPTLWECLSLHKNKIAFIKPVYDEIDPVSTHHRQQSSEEKKLRYPLRTWLDSCNFEVITLDERTNNEALHLELKYETNESSSGAGSNDIALIAFARKHHWTLVTLEKVQLEAPKHLNKYKIPLICKLENVECINFIEFLRRTCITI